MSILQGSYGRKEEHSAIRLPSISGIIISLLNEGRAVPVWLIKQWNTEIELKAEIDTDDPLSYRLREMSSRLKDDLQSLEWAFPTESSEEVKSETS